MKALNSNSVLSTTVNRDTYMCSFTKNVFMLLLNVMSGALVDLLTTRKGRTTSY